MHGLSVLLQPLQLAGLMAAVLIHLQKLPPQLLLNLNLHSGTSALRVHVGCSLFVCPSSVFFTADKPAWLITVDQSNSSSCWAITV